MSGFGLRADVIDVRRLGRLEQSAQKSNRWLLDVSSIFSGASGSYLMWAIRFAVMQLAAGTVSNEAAKSSTPASKTSAPDRRS